MTTAIQPAGGTAGGPGSGVLADVIDTILDKGLVVDAYVRLSLVGIELVTIDARIVVASVDTYLRFAEAVNRLDVANEDSKAGLPDLVGEVTSGASKHKTKGALEAAGEKLGDLLTEPKTKRVPSERRGSRRD
jgi:gas vesicle structural protein